MELESEGEKLDNSSPALQQSTINSPQTPQQKKLFINLPLSQIQNLINQPNPYLVKDDNIWDSKYVVIKIFREFQESPGEGLNPDQVHELRFMRQFKHPNIQKFLDVFFHDEDESKPEE